MAINTRKKGNRAQKNVINVISKWANKKFKSSKQFGGPNWNHDPHVGDILCDTEGHFFPFCIEVKFYEKIDFSHLLVPKIKNIQILDFWKQCTDDARNTQKVPILMMRYNGLPKEFFFLVTTQEFAKMVHDLLPKNVKTLRYHNYYDNKPIMIFRSTQFLKTDYKAVKALAKTHIKQLYK